MDMQYKKGKMMITKMMTTVLKPLMPLAACPITMTGEEE
jgi:hypothetical protein